MGNMFFGLFHEIQSYDSENSKKQIPNSNWLYFAWNLWFDICYFILEYGMGMAQNRYWPAERLGELPDTGKQDQRCNEKTTDPWITEQPEYFQQRV